MSKPPSSVNKLTAGISSIGRKIFHNPLQKIGVSWLTVRRFKYFAKPGLQSLLLFGHPTYFSETNEFFYGLREMFLKEPYKQVLPDNAFVIDCGAHIGLSVLYIKHICPSAHILAYEPDSKNFDLLQKNVTSHALENIELKNEAVWKEDMMIEFKQDGDMSSKIVEDGNGAGKVRAVRLKNSINRQVDFLKLDIEGAEYTILKDIADNLGYVRNLFIEYHGTYRQNNELCEILDIVVKNGFHFYIKEAHDVYHFPFYPDNTIKNFDVQLNIFAIRT